MPGDAGDPCQVYDFASGRDSCDVGLTCLGSNEEDLGACTHLCGGTEDSPTCPPDLTCVALGGGTSALCLRPCDPNAASCPDGFSCVPRDGTTVCLDDDDLARIVDDPDG